MSRVLAVFGLLMLLSLGFAAPALAQPQPQVVITAPPNGGRVAGPDVTVTIQVTGTTLVPAPMATKLEDMHVHYILDMDPTPWLDGKRPIPMGNPNIVHSGALTNTFAGVAPGPHRVAVVLGLSSHVAVQPPVAPSVSFTVGGTAGIAPAQLPRTGDAGDPTPLALGAGVVGIAIGIALRALARRRLRLGHGR
jgi:LPXTG-motif cell wall-anchored protein